MNKNRIIKYDWLIVIFILDVEDSAPYINGVLDDIKKIKLTAQTKVFFIKDNIQRIRQSKEILYHLECLEFIYDQKKSITKCQEVSFSGIDFSKSDAWKLTLEHLLLTYESHHLALFSWSHGAGLSITNPAGKKFVENKNSYFLIREKSNKIVKSISKLDKKNKITDSPFEHYGDAIVVDRCKLAQECNFFDYLYISDFSSALKKAVKLRKRKIDIVVMNNCYMQTLDNCYNFSDITDYFIAAMTGIQLEPGFDMPGFISHVNQLATSSACLINELLNRYNNLNGYLENEAIFANELSKTKKIIPLLDKCIKYIYKKKDVRYPILLNIVRKSIHKVASENSYFDLLTFLELASKEFLSIKFARFVSSIRNIIVQDIVTNKIVGRKLTENDSNPAKKKFGCTGLSIYIPTDEVKKINVNCDVYYQYWRQGFKSRLVSDSGWDEFVIDFANFIFDNRK